MSNIRIKQYEQTADEKVSLNGIKWLRKWDVCVQCDSAEEAEALRARLTQPEQKPMAWWHDRGDVVDLNVSGHGTPLYFAPPQREWVGLTDEDIEGCLEISIQGTCRAIEAKLKDKNK